MLNVTGALYQQPGKRHEYHLSDGSSVVECPPLPVSSRWQFWDNMNHRIYKKGLQSEMKAAVDYHKKKWGCK
ncbi:hypothetical protein BBW68_03285 [Candidatus Erwinia dacicola]|uniref:Uncharacterized protein n=1 Tax=Candidatus Erwinia dacicola TaxID=252393 RepID=A0A1E7YUI3_9GAMM|nr:hypothetical protein BBW68_03285 [Candidatus Erwinia dacicola]RAP70323.1 hypothetical protein ACZ87_02876 [Candidatus Erwinia dacicola]